MPKPDEQDPRPGHAQPWRERDALDAPPAACTRPDRRRPVAGRQALGVLAGTTGVVAAVLLVLDALLPSWCRGFLLIAAPVLVGGVLSRYRLPVWCGPAVVAAAAAYVGLLLLAVG